VKSVSQSAKRLSIASIEAYSGKSGIVLAIAHLLISKELSVAYGKPLGTCLSNSAAVTVEEDVQAIAQILALPETKVRSPLLYLDEQTIEKRLQGTDETDYTRSMQQYVEAIAADLVLLEGAGTLYEGSLFDLSVGQIVGAIDAAVLLVTRYTSPLVVDNLLHAKKELGDRLIGVVINDIPIEKVEEVQNSVKPFLEQQEIAVLGMLPSSKLLRSVSVRELARQLNAKVLCRSDRLDWMVESLTIGAMNVNAALEYFRQRENQAVVTGGDRTDLQLAALETSTSCLILTGHVSPQPLILSRAEDLEVPILAVDLDTLTTVEIVDRAFGQVRIQEKIKVECMQKLMATYFDLDRFLAKMGLQPN
jgi:uncharacterized protein